MKDERGDLVFRTGRHVASQLRPETQKSFKSMEV